MHRALPLAALSCSACTEPIEDDSWLSSAVDLGEPIATGAGYAISGSTEAWLAAEQVVPGMIWEHPGIDLPVSIWESIYEDETVADFGSCPYVIAEGATLTWVTNCRSQEGYDWSGTVSRTHGEIGEQDWVLWDLDLEVIADNDDPLFARIELRGSVYELSGTGELVQAIQANVLTGVEDFPSVAQGDDDQKSVWVDWAVTGRFEEHSTAEGRRHLLSGTTDLGSLGGLSFEGDLRFSSCPTEPDGDLVLGADVSAVLSLDGSSSCDQCASMAIDGADVGEACRY